MSSSVHLVLLVLVAGVPAATGNGGGAPQSACVDMSPNHTVDAQSTESPYSLDVDGNVISAGSTLKGTVFRVQLN